MKQTTQNSKILRALKRGRRLTAIDALKQFGCFRLASRIYDLRCDGYSIETRTVETKTGKHVTEYSLRKQ